MSNLSNLQSPAVAYRYIFSVSEKPRSYELVGLRDVRAGVSVREHIVREYIVYATTVEDACTILLREVGVVVTAAAARVEGHVDVRGVLHLPPETTAKLLVDDPRAPKG